MILWTCDIIVITNLCFPLNGVMVFFVPLLFCLAETPAGRGRWPPFLCLVLSEVSSCWKGFVSLHSCIMHAQDGSKRHSMLWEKTLLAIQCYGKRTLQAIQCYGNTSSDSQKQFCLLHSVRRTKRQEEASPHHRNSYSCSFSHWITI